MSTFNNKFYSAKLVSGRRSFNHEDKDDDNNNFSQRIKSSNSFMSANSNSSKYRDELYKLRLEIITEKLKGQAIQNHGMLPPVRHDENRGRFNNKEDSYDRLNSEIEKTKKDYRKLKERLKYQELEQRLSTSKLSNNVGGGEDKFGRYMEMMMLQQTQSQNMIFNHVMLNNQNHSKPYVYSPPQQQEVPTYVYPPPQREVPAYVYPPPQREVATYISPPQFYSLNPYPANAAPNHEPVKQAPPTLQPTLKPPILFSKDKYVDYPYPGNEAQISMRQLTLAALFCAILKANYEEQHLFLNDRFLFEIKIKEIITAIHAIYLDEDSEIRNEIENNILNSVDFRVLITRSANSDEMKFTEDQLKSFIENVSVHISEIMPSIGTLGCESKSLLSEFVQTNQMFPENYFYYEELELFQLDDDAMLHSVGIIEAEVLLIGIFIVRALVCTVMLKPVDYGLTSDLSVIGKENLRIAATVLVYIYRSLLADFIAQRFPNSSNKRKYIVRQFRELEDVLLTDEEMEPVLKRLNKTVKYAKDVLAKWVFTYASKLRPQ